ncbi:MAG: PLP-dependent aminotransferase family protein [Clostridiales bacterium]|nr:PLP-dependent aminotransferase family protein [Clostridiales bacterium]
MKYDFSNRMKDMQGSAIREIFKAAADPETISLAGGNPAPETFPAGELAKIASEILEKEGTLALQYGLTEGYPELREALRERLRQKEGIGSENDELIVVSGGQQGIDLTVKCLLNEGDGILVEEPSFIGALNAFRSYGAKLIGVPMDEDGMNLTALKGAIEANDSVKAIYTIPNHQNPSGITMSAEKRQAVYQIAKEHGLIIIEDNPYGEITFDGKPPKAIKSLDDGTTVVYCGSFSKVLSPGLRIGFCIGPKEIIAKNVIAKQVADVHTPMLTQLLAYEYMTRYDMEANIQKSAELYRHKCETMLACIEKYFPAEITHTTPNGGLFIWCDMGPGYDAAEVALRCAKEKVVFVPGNTFMVDMNKPCSAFRLNYSTMSDEKIEEGIRILGGVLSEIMK